MAGKLARESRGVKGREGSGSFLRLGSVYDSYVQLAESWGLAWGSGYVGCVTIISRSGQTVRYRQPNLGEEEDLCCQSGPQLYSWDTCGASGKETCEKTRTRMLVSAALLGEKRVLQGRSAGADTGSGCVVPHHLRPKP